MSKEISHILDTVLERVRPTLDEREKVRMIIEKITRVAKEVSSEFGIHFEARVLGSIAKDTWISGDKDIDFFILFPKKIPVQELKEQGLMIAKKIAEKMHGTYKEKYAEHPYIEAHISGYTIDIVPAYLIKYGERPITATDRTTLHTIYINNKLSSEQKDQVRILKQFMKGIEVYGAEIKVGGFSGYLCELLIAFYGSFIDVLKASRFWRPWRTVIDIEEYYDTRDYRRIIKKFASPLVVIDPVDKNRNVAAAVSIKSFSIFKFASKRFLAFPSLKFFFPPEERPLSRAEYLSKIAKRGTCILGLRLQITPISPDILWGQIFRTLKSLKKFLERRGFCVISEGAWSDEESEVIFLVEVDKEKLIPLEKHMGPPVGSEEEDNFIRKYLENTRVLSGPVIENRRWYVYRLRERVEVEEIIRSHINEISFGKDLSKHISSLTFGKNEEVFDFSLKNSYRKYLRKWLDKKYSWMT